MFKRSRVNDHWKVENGRMIVTGNLGAGRWIFGIPWMGFGVYFLYKYLVLGIIEYIKAGAIRGIFTGIFGWLFILVIFGGIFLVPGWVMVFLRRKVVVDTTRGEVNAKNDFLIYSRNEKHSLTELDRILLVETFSRSKDGKTTYLHDVRLVGADEKKYVLVASMQDEEEAERLGNELARLVRLPFQMQEESVPS